MDPAAAAAYWTGPATAAEGYFRPGTPRLERRQAEAQRVWGLLQSSGLQLPQEGEMEQVCGSTTTGRTPKASAAAQQPFDRERFVFKTLAGVIGTQRLIY